MPPESILFSYLFIEQLIYLFLFLIDFTLFFALNNNVFLFDVHFIYHLSNFSPYSDRTLLSFWRSSIDTYFIYLCLDIIRYIIILYPMFLRSRLFMET